MSAVKITIPDRDKYIGVMIRALAFEVAGPEAVKGATKDCLECCGYLQFNFFNDDKADEFRGTVRTYVPGKLAQIDT